MNVYDIRKQKELYYILDASKKISSNKCANQNRNNHIIIVIYLYYEDMLEDWGKYIAEIPDYIKCFVISSNKNLIEQIRSIESFKGIEVISKPNNGRDISALLVTARDIILNAEYACFVHDKKEHQNRLRTHETDLWVYNMWQNTIGSRAFIENVIDEFEMDTELGILSVPEPIGYYYDTWAGRGWYGSYNATRELAEKLELDCDISTNKPPISVGTALWFRTKALNKLFTYPWNYTDFDDSKLANGDYISYAVERIFPYVAEDAGFKTGIVMTSEYAEKQTAYAQDLMKIYADTLYELIGITQGGDCIYVLHRYEKLKNSLGNVSKIFLYGAGKWGRVCLRLLRLAGKEPNGFVVSQKSEDQIEDVVVFDFENISGVNEDTLFIITVENPVSKEEIKSKLDEKKYKYFCFWE